MSAVQLLMTLRAAWLRIALMVLVATGIAYFLADQEPRQYTAKARVMLNLQNTDPARYSAEKKGIAAGYIGTEMRLMIDNSVTREVVTNLGWPDNPQVIAAWQAETGGVGDVTTWAAHRIAAGIAPRQLEDSSIVEIYYTTSSLEAAKQIAGLLRAAYIDQSQRLRSEAAKRASAWNRTAANRALAVVKEAEAARAAFVTANQIPLDTPGGGLDYAAEVTALRTAVNPDVVSEVNRRFSAVADQLARRIDTIDAQLAVLRQTGENNPMTVSLEAQRAATVEQLARERAVQQNTPGTPENTVELVRAQRDADYLKARLNMIARAPLYDRLATMNRDVRLKTERYNAAAERVAEFDAVAATPSGVQVIGDVIADPDPTYPNMLLIVGMAAGSSLALAVALAVLAELTRPQVRGIADLAATIPAPVLAVIGDGHAVVPWRSRLRWLSPRRRLLPAG